MQEQSGGASGGKTICFTGKMPEKRSYYEKLAKAAGYEPADSVTSSLSVLVAADINDNSSKLVKARKAGIRIISLAEFLAEQSSASAAETASDETPIQGDLFGF